MNELDLTDVSQVTTPNKSDLSTITKSDLSTVNKDTGLDERETYFLDILFDECAGNIAYAMKQAGYPPSVSPQTVRRKLQKHIQEASKLYLTSATAEASYNLVKVFQDPNALGTKNVISAAKEILDRGGVTPPEEINVAADNIVIMLPPKKVKVIEGDFKVVIPDDIKVISDDG